MIKKERGESDSKYSQDIKRSLEEGPASINDICKELKISWATAKSALENMKEQGEVKEIISNPKIRIFRLSNDPAFYGIPLTKKQKNDSLFLFETIRKEWKEREEKKKGPLLATALQKIAVDVAKKYDFDIPTARFHYGMVVPVFETPLFRIQTPEKSKQIINIVQKQISLHKNNAKEEMIEQYEKEGMVLYQVKERLKEKLENQNNEEIESLLSKILMAWPIDNKDPEIFSLFSEFVGEVHGLIITKTFGKNKQKVIECFDVLWDLITTYLLFKDLEKNIENPKKEIFEYIKSYHLLSKKANAEERINFLGSLANIDTEIEMPTDEESVTMRRILTEGVEEE